MALFFYSALKG